jgi:uncharacterized protein YjaG (DUF416 family)
MKDKLIERIENIIYDMSEYDLANVISYINTNLNTSIVENGILNSNTFYYQADLYGRRVIKFRTFFTDDTFHYISEDIFQRNLSNTDWKDCILFIDKSEINPTPLYKYIFDSMKFRKTYQEAKELLIEDTKERIESLKSDIEEYNKEIDELLEKE